MTIKKGGAKVDNHPAAFEAKAEIRRNVAAALGGLPSCHVFDAFAGAGEMHGAVWKDAASYTGCDKRYFPDGRYAYVADNTRVLRAIGLERFNVFDLDAYGSPWEQVMIICARRRVAPGEKIGFLLTEGSALQLKMGGISGALSNMSGVTAKFQGKNHVRDKLYDRAILGLGSRINAALLKRWQAYKGGGKGGSSDVSYIGLVFEGKRDGEAPEPAGEDASSLESIIADVVAHADVSGLEDDGFAAVAPPQRRRGSILQKTSDLRAVPAE